MADQSQKLLSLAAIGTEFADRMRKRAKFFERGPMYIATLPPDIQVKKVEVEEWADQVRTLLCSIFGASSDQLAQWESVYAGRETASDGLMVDSEQATLDAQYLERCANRLRLIATQTPDVSKAEAFVKETSNSAAYVWRKFGVAGVVVAAVALLLIVAAKYGKPLIELAEKVQVAN